MKRAKEQLLELTRCSLWGGDPDLSLFEEGVEWPKILQLAKAQTLQGLLSGVIERLPSQMRPPRGEVLRLHQLVSLNRQYRSHQIEVLDALQQLVKRAGVERPVLLKGLGVGLNYPTPSLRQSGDIDLYVGDSHYRAVREFLAKELNITEVDDRSDHHFEFEFMGTNVEIHRYATAPNSVAFKSREFTDWCREQLGGDELRRVEIEGVEVLLPTYNFDFIFIFYHTWRHFLMGGVGLRQFCDWCCYIDTFADRFDREELKRLVTKYHLEKPISLFATIAVRELGVKAERMPNYVASSDELYQSALERVWSRGNFGRCNVDLERRSRGFLARKVLGLMAMIRDMRYLMRLDCRYALRFYVLNIIRGLKLAIKYR